MPTENALTITSGSITNSTAIESTPPRKWRDTPDGSNDFIVDIWYNGKWVPAYFSDIKKGDFYLLLNVNLDPTQCFFAAADCIRMGGSPWAPTLGIPKGSEIVQAPAIKDINTIASPTERKLLK